MKKKILALIAVLSLATVTACGQLNTAATLGDITISQASFEATVTELVKAREEFDTSQMQLEEGATLNRSQLRFTGLCLGLAQAPSSGRLPVCAAQQPADRLLLAFAAGAGRATARRRGAAGRRHRQRMGMHAGARGGPSRDAGLPACRDSAGDPPGALGVGQRDGAVLGRVALAEHVEVDAVEGEDLHGLQGYGGSMARLSRICGKIRFS